MGNTAPRKAGDTKGDINPEDNSKSVTDRLGIYVTHSIKKKVLMKQC